MTVRVDDQGLLGVSEMWRDTSAPFQLKTILGCLLPPFDSTRTFVAPWSRSHFITACWCSLLRLHMALFQAQWERPAFGVAEGERVVVQVMLGRRRAAFFGFAPGAGKKCIAVA
jgi:hypothetical protein